MAHKFHIPVEFEFRIARVEWSVASGHVTGFRKSRDPDGETFIGLNVEFPRNGSTEVVVFGFEVLPRKELDQCATKWKERRPIGDEDDELLRAICAGWKPQLLVPSVRINYQRTRSEFMKLSLANAWQMRKDFERMAPDHEGALAFLNKWGHWGSGGFTDLIDLKDILRLQSQVREALTPSSADKWFTSHDPSRLDFWKREAKDRFFAVRTCLCKDAICVTVTADLLRGAKFKFCARKDCRASFEVRSKHKKKYCCQYCGHLESVRKNRRSRTSGGSNVDL